jgi:5-methylcytosine-specific restriction protein B
MFSWIQIHEEVARQLIERQAKGEDVVAVVREMSDRGLTVISLDDKDVSGQTVPVNEIDPFTFFSTFNRGITESNRRENWTFLKERWQLSSPVPSDFTGIPVVHNMQSWFFGWAKDRRSDHIQQLWKLAAQAVTARDVGDVDAALFNTCAELPVVGLRKLTIGLFWLNPKTFLPADKKTAQLGASRGIKDDADDAETYRQWVARMTKALGNNYPEISHEAHVAATAGSPSDEDPPAVPSAGRRYWLLGTGKDGKLWDSFRDDGAARIGFDPTPDLRQFKSEDDVAEYLRKLHNVESSKKNDAKGCWQFAHDVRKGDVIFAKQGASRVLGYGIVDGDYYFDGERPRLRHARKVNWLASGDWELPADNRMPIKTLTDISDPALLKTLAELVGLDLKGSPAVPPSSGTAYWWLNANPKIWDLEGAAVGTRQTYTSHNEKGNKRQKFRYFEEIKPDDIVVGYVTSPQREIVAICRITKGLHPTPQGDAIEFEKIESLKEPVPYATLQASTELEESEPIRNNQGSLFRLTEREYEVIRSLIDDINVDVPTDIKPYSKRTALAGLFLSEGVFDEMLAALKEKKNIVLQGAPGVGKTFVAKRLAYAFIGSDDPQRVQLIQFHQSYSYEDFVQGFRPTAKGHFELTPGLFYQFCRRAQRHEATNTPHVLIIDEINRGNLSKIFGELMMLIEPDKRGRRFSMPLAYAQDPDDTFFVPANLYVIGMMNTADRSLALVDYALRRRFRFITLRPEFGSDRFRRWLLDAGADAGLIDRIATRMQALNEVIAADTKNLGAGYQIGHSFFCPTDGVRPDEAWYRRVIESEVVPLLQEYWFDDDQKVQERRSALLA